jgi:hypothetical protein
MGLIQLPQYYAIFNQMIPSEGGRAVPLALDFSSNNSWTINMTQLLSMKVIDVVQTIYIDNSLNSVSLLVNSSISNQNITVPPYSQGYYPILVPNNATLTFTCIGGLINTPIFLINIPLPAISWNKNGTPFLFNGSGYLEVSDPVLDAAIANNLVNILNHKTGTGGTSYPDWIGNIVVSGSLTTTTAALITGAPGYFITGAGFYLSQQATQAAAGDMIFTLNDSVSGAIYTWSEYVPSVAGGLNPNNAQIRTPPGFIWNNKTNASTLNITTSAALTAGTLKYNINYGLTTIVG